MVYDFQYKETILVVDNVSRVIDGKTIVRDINLEVKDVVRPGMTQGQIISLLGPSGRGKSQIAMMLAGLVQPTTGGVWIGPEQYRVKMGDVGVVQQHYPLFDFRTVENNLMVAASVKIPDANLRKERVDEMLEIIGMEEHRKKYPAQLSGGQRQRVAIGQQVLCSQQFLILDEPFSGLDPIMIRQVSDLIRKVSTLDEYNTVIIITHDLQTAAVLSDTLWILGKSTTGEPGSTIRNQYNLAQMGLAWRPGIENTGEFFDLMRQLRNEFLTL